MNRASHNLVHTRHADLRAWLRLNQSSPLIHERSDIVASAKEDLDLEAADIAELRNKIIDDKNFFEFEPVDVSDN